MVSALEPILQRDITVNEAGCWLWQGAKTWGGYGAISREGRKGIMLHRYVYEILVGPIPEGLELDHSCKVRSCVNPIHLEPVTHAENQKRAAAHITHCINGHEYTPANTCYVGKTQRRNCRECRRLATQRYRGR